MMSPFTSAHPATLEKLVNDEAAQPLKLKFLDLGRRDYRAVWKMQKNMTADRAEGRIPDTVLLVEHPAVYTRGISARGPAPENLAHPLLDVERGGDITFHGPGQLVGYPILHLQRRGLLVGTYLRRLESALIAALAPLGIRGEAVPGKTGVWARGRKLASIGVSVRGWVSYHGFALNVCGDLAPFKAIRPCGFEPEVMTSVSDLLGRSVDLEEMRTSVIDALEKEFTQ